MTGSSHTGDDAVDPNAETPVPTEAPDRPSTVDAYVLSGRYPSISEASVPVVAEFSMDQLVPRAEPATREFTSTDIFLRLEQTIYGPLSRERLAELLASGRLTGFEQASSNLRTWTPLIYHPRMVLAEDVDPETTHRMLQTESNLPKESAVQRRIDLAQYGEAEAPTSDAPATSAPATPLAKMLIRPRKRSTVALSAVPSPSLDLPVFGDLGHETLETLAQRASAPGAGTMMMPAIAALAEASVESADPLPEASAALPVAPSFGEPPGSPGAAGGAGSSSEFVTVPNPAVAPITSAGLAAASFQESEFSLLLGQPFGAAGNELPTLQVPATDGAGAVAETEPTVANVREPGPELAPREEGASAAGGNPAIFALALALAAVACAAAVYFYLRVATLEHEIRVLRQSLPANQR